MRLLKQILSLIILVGVGALTMGSNPCKAKALEDGILTLIEEDGEYSVRTPKELPNCSGALSLASDDVNRSAELGQAQGNDFLGTAVNFFDFLAKPAAPDTVYRLPPQDKTYYYFLVCDYYVSQGGYRSVDYYPNVAVNWGAVDSPPVVEPNAPAAPSNLLLVPLSATQIYTEWTDNSSDEEGFKIESSTDGLNFSQIGVAAADDIGYTASGLAPSTTYHFRVRAFKGAANSAYTTAQSTMTQSGAPDAPTNLVAQSVGPQINLTWNDSASDETGFEIERGTNPGGPYTVIEAAHPPEMGFTATYFDTSVAPSTTYYYRVRALKTGFPASAYSNEADATTP